MPQRGQACALQARLRSQVGLSLVEVLVAAGLIALALMPVAYVQSSGLRSGNVSYQLLAASALAEDLLNKARALPYTDGRLSATTGYADLPTSLSNTNPIASDGTTCGTSTCGYTRKWQITDNTPLNNTKQIDVKVSWSEYGVTNSYVLSTVKAVGS